MPSKLVRDKIPEIITRTGKTPNIHIAADEEFRQKLLEKLQEEVNEFCVEPVPEELADILEVIDALYETFGIDHSDVQTLKNEKKEKRGGFTKKFIFEDI